MIEATPERPSVTTFGRALLAGSGGLAGSFAWAGFSPDFIAAPVAGFLAREMPAVVIRYSITLLGSLGQKLNLLTALGISLVLLSLVALLGIRVERRLGVRFLGTGVATILAAASGVVLTGSAATALGVGAGTGVVLAISDLATEFESLSGPFDPERRTVIGGVAAVAGIGAVSAIRQRSGTGGSPPEEPEALSDDAGASPPSTPAATHTATPRSTAPEQEPTSSGAATAETPSTAATPISDTATPSPTPERSAIGQLLHEASEKSLGIEDLDPLVSESFYEVDINAVNPEVNVDDWSLSVTGAVDSTHTYSWSDITDMEAEHRFVTLRCVGEQLNGKKMDNALWTGVPLDRFLDAATPASDCDCVMLRAADGYYEEFPLEALRGGLLAYGMNGELLPKRHGRPLRALVPGHWGEVNVKWLTEIELLDREKQGYWEERGWHGTGPVHTVAKIHAVNKLESGRVQLAGHTYAGTRGIEKVEVSIAGGSWKTATLSEPLPGDDVWRQWVYEYDPPSGEHEVVARAVDGTGTVQTKERSRPFPNGATGWVTWTVQP